ncbi:hypothetical protein MTR_2g029230 [Medicago truncatula]|uniref:Uncharacterized protein n=1 Tax=Medicago truncatula TaxID=3880 RepID=A0A072V6P8_MEDTR|nr:hypothetical protein MTR_2g029230 [Medicago truncatula]
MAMRRVIRKSVFTAVTASTTSSPSLTLIDGVNKTLNTGNPVFNNVLSSKLLFSSNHFLSSSFHHSERDSPISKYGKDLTELARLSNVHAIIAQGDEIDRCIEILSRGSKNKPVIIGEPSLRRYAVVEGLYNSFID